MGTVYSDWNDRQVVLTESAWSHIKRSHPEDTEDGLLEAIGETVQDPDSVYKSSNPDYISREVLFKHNTNTDYFTKYGFWTKVVCDYDLTEEQPYNRVVTAFKARSEGGGIGERLYKRP